MNTYMVQRNGVDVQMYFADSHAEAEDFADDIDAFMVKVIYPTETPDLYIMEVY